MNGVFFARLQAKKRFGFPLYNRCTTLFLYLNVSVTYPRFSIVIITPVT